MKKLLALFFTLCIILGTASFVRAEDVFAEKTLLELSAELVSEEILSELANPDAWLDDRTAAYLESWNFAESAYVQILQTVIWNHPMDRSDEFERLTNEEAYLYKYWMIDGDSFHTIEIPGPNGSKVSRPEGVRAPALSTMANMESTFMKEICQSTTKKVLSGKERQIVDFYCVGQFNADNDVAIFYKTTEGQFIQYFENYEAEPMDMTYDEYLEWTAVYWTQWAEWYQPDENWVPTNMVAGTPDMGILMRQYATPEDFFKAREVNTQTDPQSFFAQYGIYISAAVVLLTSTITAVVIRKNRIHKYKAGTWESE